MNGLGDPVLRVSVNFYGALALNLQEFMSYRQDLIIGASLRVTAPLGQYDASRAVNPGTNRWSIRPELGVSQAFGTGNDYDWVGMALQYRWGGGL